MVYVCCWLYRLSNSEGNPVDDVELIRALQASKAKSQEIEVKMMCVLLFLATCVRSDWTVIMSPVPPHLGQSGVCRADREGH